MTGDLRDAPTWVVLELTSAGEALAREGGLEKALRDHLGVDSSHPVFVPCVRFTQQERTVSICLMEGYAFVASGLGDSDYVALERDCPYVRSVLSQPGRVRTLKVVQQRSIDDMRKQLAEQIASDIEEGMTVVVNDGLYSSLEGEVLLLDGDHAKVMFTMRSLKSVQTIPRAFLSPLEDQ